MIRVQAEITQGQINLFNSHALVKAQAKEYVRESQSLLILQPLIEKLMSVFWSPSEIDKCLSKLIEKWRSVPQPGYLAGNIINILRELNIDLSNYDFSGLTVWQANLQNLRLHQVNFAGCDLSQSIFTEALGNILAVAFSPQGNKFAT